MNEYNPAMYNADFYKKRRNKHRAAGKYMRVLAELHGPFTSVLDVGAGDGYCAHVLAGKGVEAWAVELSEAVLHYSFSDVRYVIHDLREPLDLEKKFDLVLCVEVAEHLPESAADTLCDTLVAHTARLLVFTAAPPGQVGSGHVNLQLPGYWTRKFVDRGMYPMRAETRALKRAWAAVLGKGSQHIQKNLQLWRPK